MADLEQRLRALEDREAIRNLIASYGALADCGAADELAALWNEPVVPHRRPEQALCDPPTRSEH